MHNKYTIEIFNDGQEVKAKIFLGNDCLGTIWRPNNNLTFKQHYTDFFLSLGNVIYGQEQKAAKEQELYSQIIAEIDSKKKREQEDLSEEQGC